MLDFPSVFSSASLLAERRFLPFRPFLSLFNPKSVISYYILSLFSFIAIEPQRFSHLSCLCLR